MEYLSFLQPSVDINILYLFNCLDSVLSFRLQLTCIKSCSFMKFLFVLIVAADEWQKAIFSYGLIKASVQYHQESLNLSGQRFLDNDVCACCSLVPAFPLHSFVRLYDFSLQNPSLSTEHKILYSYSFWFQMYFLSVIKMRGLSILTQKSERCI